MAALYSGAEAVKPLLHPLKGLELGEEGYVTVGEYRGKKLSSYDYNNSPSEMLNQNLKGKKVAICSTNGSLAIVESPGSYVGCFMNLKYMAEVNAVPYPVGRLGNFAIEDDLCAHSILALRHGIDLDYEGVKKKITERFQGYLREGREIPMEDLEVCLQPNSYPLVPYYDGDEVRPIQQTGPEARR